LRRLRCGANAGKSKEQNRTQIRVDNLTDIHLGEIEAALKRFAPMGDYRAEHRNDTIHVNVAARIESDRRNPMRYHPPK
jgi:hypothetical protein